MQTVLLIVHVLVAAGLIGMVLLQQGKGADAGAAFGSGASATVFGARGAASFLTRSTAVLATLFFITSLSLAYFSGSSSVSRKSVTEIVTPAQPGESKPAQANEDLPVLPQEQPGSGDVPTPAQK